MDHLAEVQYWNSEYSKTLYLNFNKFVSDFEIHANNPMSRDCIDSKFVYPRADHVITGSL